MKLDGQKLNNFLKISLIAVNLFVVNTYLILFSILSIGILTPALIGATYCEVEKILQYDMLGVHKRFFTNVFLNFKATFGKILICNIYLTLIIGTILFFNNVVMANYNLVMASIIIGTQIIMVFELFNIIQVSLIQIFVLKNNNVNEIIKNSFAIVNTNIIRFLLASVSIVIAIALVTKLSIFIVVFISFTLTLYYISITNVVKEFYEKYY